MPTPDARERILGTATRLFDRHGVHAVGLQRIIDECGCGKNLLYTCFASKDELVVAYLRCCGAAWDVLLAGAKAAAAAPERQLVELVREVGVRATRPGSRGCPLRATLAEFPEPRHPAHRVAVDQLVRARTRLRELAGETSAADPGRLADRVMVIIDGLYASGPVFGGDAAEAAVTFAEDVVCAETSAAAESR
ncbi:TetR/AcrR family transcriptional regulator [Amycolatopsis mongoliensis]|uniref:TetR/AcrR family transcriptional regulator n=1 Tax=Amycolatopsis mongoliensis TaxID=715475 RepID=A0A9Y2JSI8_9PSEU|nr:TetR/AcrR family transcriptional regulator [Amycolatopsis sp. 4-36]WIY02149.1 TetR/AcrR family transcriptional regulator [Amycolatopsis sp. 4-36]